LHMRVLHGYLYTIIFCFEYPLVIEKKRQEAIMFLQYLLSSTTCRIPVIWCVLMSGVYVFVYMYISPATYFSIHCWCSLDLLLLLLLLCSAFIIYISSSFAV
jgi:hypothetical protein